MGTDDEASGVPVTREQVDAAAAQELSRQCHPGPEPGLPPQDDPLPFRALLWIIPLLAVVVALVAWAL